VATSVAISPFTMEEEWGMNSTTLLEVNDLHVEVEGREVLKGVSLKIGEGEVHAVFGPNGSGKTTLLGSVMGLGKYRVTKGTILFGGTDITGMSVDERARLGVGMSFQRPPTINGVKLRSLLEICDGGDSAEIEALSEKLNVTPFLDREVNAGLSGGELKRVELLQLLLQKPELVFLDEPESGVDLENMALIGRASASVLGRERPMSACDGCPGTSCRVDVSLKEMKELRYKAGLLITHTGHIMDYVNVDKGHVMMDGRIVCSGNAGDILAEIRRSGYSECFRCLVKEGVRS